LTSSIEVTKMGDNSYQDFPLIMTTEEVAKFLRVHRTTVERYARSGELKSYKLGGRRLYKREEVWAFLENRIAQECVSGGSKLWQL
jgi:excisionase family DNA binding protein